MGLLLTIICDVYLGSEFAISIICTVTNEKYQFLEALSGLLTVGRR